MTIYCKTLYFLILNDRKHIESELVDLANEIIEENKRNSILVDGQFFSNLTKELLEALFESKPYLENYIPEKMKVINNDTAEMMFRNFENDILRICRIINLAEPNTDSKVINAVCLYSMQNIQEAIDMETIANHFYMNKKYLSTLFKQKTGIKFTDYKKKIIIERAKKLISDTDLRIYEIAEQLGFNDIDYFSKCFKKETDQSPSEYNWSPVDDLYTDYEIHLEDNDEIRIGIIEAFSGDYACTECGRRYLYQMAADEVNETGGIYGKKVKLIFKDFESDPQKSVEMADELIKENVDAIMGGILSSSREMIRPIIDANHIVYLYNSLYEGGVADHYTFCVDTMPEQNLEPVIKYMLDHGKKTFYIISSDYNYGILSGEFAKTYIETSGGIVVANEYFQTEKSQFAISIENIIELNPDVLITFLVGEKQNGFYEEWAKKGNKNILLISPTAVITHCIQKFLPKGTLNNIYFASPFVEETEAEAARKWCNSVRERYTEEQVPYIGSEQEVAYLAMKLYLRAVKTVHSTRAETVIKALESGGSFDAPEGKVTINPKDHHIIRDVGIYKINNNNEIIKVGEEKQIRSTFIENILKRNYFMEGGLREMGKKSPNIQYNTMFYKI